MVELLGHHTLQATARTLLQLGMEKCHGDERQNIQAYGPRAELVDEPCGVQCNDLQIRSSRGIAITVAFITFSFFASMAPLACFLFLSNCVCSHIYLLGS